MIDEADKFSRMIYTMTLCFDGEKKRKEKIKLGDKLQTNYILYCVTIEFFRWGFFSREYGDESFFFFLIKNYAIHDHEGKENIKINSKLLSKLEIQLGFGLIEIAEFTTG